ncbi:MAG: hypothetical protein M0Z70_07755 [Nitrospiraceae bacterium]|nr:hypothetical protein [Nitrospiraceae bacterium]
MRNILFMLFLVLVMLGSGYASDKDKPPTDYQGPIAERPKLVKGDRWEYTRRDQVISFEFAGEENGNLVFYVQWNGGGKMKNIRTPDLNFIKEFNKKGEIVEECNPYKGALRFPLWIGKKWSYTFTTTKLAEHGGAGELADRDSDVKVVSYEQIKVPAGTFWAFKIEEHRVTRGARGPKARLGYNSTVWYSPEVKNIIKVEEDKEVYNRDLIKYIPAK